MFDLDKQTAKAGAYVLYDGYFIFMVGYGIMHKESELGVVRFGGHCESGETVLQCAAREVREESSLDCDFINSYNTYVLNNDGELQLIQYQEPINPTLILVENDNKLSVMYFAYGHGTLTPAMETQGVLLLRREDIRTFCTEQITLSEYRDRGGQIILAKPLPEDNILIPHTQVLFLHKLFKLEPTFMEKFELK